MTTATELRQITQRKNELRADYDVEILDLIDIITRAYLCGDDIGREVASNRRAAIAARLQENVS
jgi:hypothetical protein